MYSINETIVALATPPGEGAIGVIRLSGKDAIEITDRIFKGKKLSKQASHTVHFGRIVESRNGGQDAGVATVGDEVVVSLSKGP